MARGRFQRRIGTNRDYQCSNRAQQGNAGCVRLVSTDELHIVLIDLKPASVQALSTTSSELWKTQTTNSPSHITTWGAFPFPLTIRAGDDRFHSFDVSVKLSKGQIFMVDALRWAPVGFAAWIFEKSRRPGLVRLRENRAYGHEVAIKLVEERKREPNDSRKDILTLLGLSCVAFMKIDG